jgi:hypothetical protein
MKNIRICVLLKMENKFRAMYVQINYSLCLFRGTDSILRSKRKHFSFLFMLCKTGAMIGHKFSGHPI